MTSQLLVWIFEPAGVIKRHSPKKKTQFGYSKLKNVQKNVILHGYVMHASLVTTASGMEMQSITQ